ncbi:MAG: hypothetical protein ACREIO_06410, partial [Nitrospiraceae bacterium]
ASRRIMAGVDLVSVKDILGHRDIQTTLRYTHLAPGHLREAVNRGSLTATGTKTGNGIGSKTGSEQKDHEPALERAGSQVSERMNESGWLGD